VKSYETKEKKINFHSVDLFTPIYGQAYKDKNRQGGNFDI
jgi:hypothetical protein